MVSPLLAIIVVLGIIIVLNNIPSHGYLLSNIFLGILFMFAIPNIDQGLGNYYTFMILFVIVFSLMKIGAKDVDKAELGGVSFKGIMFTALSLVFGLLFYLAMGAIQTTTTGQILGVPQSLAVGGLTAFFSPALIGALGFIENRFFFGIFEVIRTFLLPTPIALIITAVLFGLFHLAAFGLALSSIMFASIIMLFWLIIFMTPLGEEATGNAHYFWNGISTIKETLTIAR